MVVIDSSAFIAVLEPEPEAPAYLRAIREADRRLTSAVTVYETGIVIGLRRSWESTADWMGFLDHLGIEIVPFSEPYIAAALNDYDRFGKGRHPKARLNLGDCASYALARLSNAPLLYKGLDFTHTDIETAAPALIRP